MASRLGEYPEMEDTLVIVTSKATLIRTPTKVDFKIACYAARYRSTLTVASVFF